MKKILLKNIGRDKPNKRSHENKWNDNTENIFYGGKKQKLKIKKKIKKEKNIYLERKYNKFNNILPS